MKTRSRRLLLILISALVLSVVGTTEWTSKIKWKHHRDRALIKEIRDHHTSAAIGLINLGADANALDGPDEPVTLRGILSKWISVLRGRASTQRIELDPPALLCVYSYVHYHVPYDPKDLGEQGVGGSIPERMIAHRVDPAPLVAALLDHGADPDPGNRVGSTLLTKACLCDDVQTVEVLLRHHVDPNVAGRPPYTTRVYSPLLYTSSFECARLLLAAGANPNARSGGSRTALMGADDPRMFQLLLNHGADPNALDDEGRTALMDIIHEWGSLERKKGVEILLAHGARVNIKDKKGKTAVDYMRSSRYPWLDQPDSVKERRQFERELLMLEDAMKAEMSAQAPRPSTDARSGSR